METIAIQSSPFAWNSDFSKDDVELLEDEYEDEDEDETLDLSCLSRRNDYDENDDELFAETRRLDRKSGADDFRNEYIFGRCMDQKICIWRSGRHVWSDKSSGITWIGVHGHDSICVVTKAEVLDVTRVHGFLLFKTMEDVECLFRRAMISEMEDLADPASKPHEMREKSINKPFGVVSVVPVTNKVHDASGDDYEENKIVKYKLKYLDKLMNGEGLSEDENSVNSDTYIKNSLKRSLRRQIEQGIHDRDLDENNIKFLQDKLNSDAAWPIKEAVQADECDEEGAKEFLVKEMKKPAEHFTKEETIKTAIYAFQRLFNRKFEAKEIGVCVMDPHYFVLSEKAHLTDPYAIHMVENEIEKYLSDMSEPESEGSCSPSIRSD